MLGALAACSHPLSAAPAAGVKTASLDCDDRTVVLDATCGPVDGLRTLACTRQTLTVKARPGGAVKAARQFAPQPATDGDPPFVEEKIGVLSCVRAPDAARYIVAELSNGGNCAQCEWREVYDWDGKLVASSRARGKPNAVLKQVQDGAGAPIGKLGLDSFYARPPR